MMNPTTITIMIFMLVGGGIAIGYGLTAMHFKKILNQKDERLADVLRRENELHRELEYAHISMDLLRGRHADISNKLLEEVCGALEGDTVDLPSFGVVDISDAESLKRIFRTAIDADYILHADPLGLKED